MRNIISIIEENMILISSWPASELQPIIFEFRTNSTNRLTGPTWSTLCVYL